MATTVTTESASGATTATEPGPDITEAFVADRQAFWSSFTSFVSMAVIAVIVLLLGMLVFLV